MEKVKVTKEVAQAIEALRKEQRSDENILRVLADPNNGWAGEKSKVLNTTPFDLVAKALYIGYEIKKTPEEELAESYRFNYLIEGQDDENRAFANGIRYAVNTLGISIKGVNA